MRYLLLSMLLNTTVQISAQDIRVHDPVMIRHNETYYLFCTGRGISVFSSADRKNWKAESPVFNAPPIWATHAIPGFKGHIWAPDILFHNGLYYLYYSVSAFGKNTSCIGLATNVTLDITDKNFKWVDHGKVVESVPGRDLWNAIDPNVAFDDAGNPWMVFGSFWNGMKLVKLSEDMKSIAEPQQWYTVSRRPRDFKIPDDHPGDGAVEAPFIFKKNGYYYLFVSFDFCCRGVQSTYKIMVGRAQQIQGPYLDKTGQPMTEGAGTLVLQGTKRWPGIGHNAVYTWDGQDYLIFHAYDAADDGKPKLKIGVMTWDEEGWPVIDKNWDN